MLRFLRASSVTSIGLSNVASELKSSKFGSVNIFISLIPVIQPTRPARQSGSSRESQRRGDTGGRLAP